MLRKKLLSERNPEYFILKTYVHMYSIMQKKINIEIKKIIQIDSQNNAEIYKLKTQGDSSTWINVHKYWWASIYEIFALCQRCRCFFDQDNRQYALSEALICTVNSPVLLTNGLYLTIGAYGLSIKRTSVFI